MKFIPLLGQMRNREDAIFHDTFFMFPNGDYHDPVRRVGNISDRDYFKRIKEEHPNYLISEAVISKTAKEPIVLVLVPLYSPEDDLLGILAGSIKLTTLSGNFVSTRNPGKSYSWITDSSGKVIAHYNDDVIMNINILETSEKDYTGLSEIAIQMQENDSGFGEYFDKGENSLKYMTYKTIPYTPNWKLAITTLKDDVFLPIRMLMITIIKVSIITLFMSIILFIFISKKTVKPLLMLTDAVTQSEQGKFSEIKIETNQDEIGRLVKAYNHMTVSIKNYTTNLELLVSERTSELRDANKKLDKQNQNLNYANEKLYTLATTDELTGLLNRAHLYEELNRMKEVVDESLSSSFSILFMDLDNFKYYNDTFGHDIGDLLLQNFSKQLRKSFRDTDILTRFGGDEFIIILSNTDFDKARQVRKNFKKTISSLDGFRDLIREWTSDKNKIPNHKKLNVSTGVSTYSSLCELEIEDLVKLADDDMYLNKRKSKL